MTQPAVARTSSSTTTPTEPLPTRAWRDDLGLTAELATLNHRIARYLMSVLDAEAERSEPLTAEQEATLGRQLVELGRRLQARAHVVSHESVHPGSG